MPDRGPECLDYGQAAANLLPFLRSTVEIFDCPSNPTIHKQAGGEGGTLIPDYEETYTEYEFNGYLAECEGENRKQSGILKYSKAAYAYDHPYNPSALRLPHEGGVNVAYLDGHANWLPQSEYGDIGTPPGSNAFFRIGHSFDDDQY